MTSMSMIMIGSEGSTFPSLSYTSQTQQKVHYYYYGNFNAPQLTSQG